MVSLSNLIILILTIFISIVNCQNNNSEVTIIVNLYNNNNYTVGKFCGNSTFTCNSISDAISYFETIKVAQESNDDNDYNSSIYQKLNLLLDTGKYVDLTKVSTMNLYGYNISIGPLNYGSSENDVFFTSTGNDEYPLITVKPNTPQDNGEFSTSILMYGLTFIDYLTQQSILLVDTSKSYSNIVVYQCEFDTTFNGNENLILFNIQNTLSTQDFNTFLIFENSTIHTIRLAYNSKFVNCLNSVLYFNNNTVQGIFIYGEQGTLLYGTNSNFNINNSSFITVNTENGAIATYDSVLTINNSTFENCYSSGTGLQGIVSFYETSNSSSSSTSNEFYYTNNYENNSNGKFIFYVAKEPTNSIKILENNTFGPHDFGSMSIITYNAYEFLIQSNQFDDPWYVLQSHQSNLTISDNTFGLNAAVFCDQSFLNFDNSNTGMENIILQCQSYCNAMYQGSNLPSKCYSNN